MKHGDLTNEIAPCIGIRFEAVIYNFGKVNQPGKALSEAILSEDTNLYLITLFPLRKVASWCYKWGVGYTRILQADSTLEIPELCFQHKLVIYYDVDDRLLQNISTRGLHQTKTIKWEQSYDNRR